MIIKLRFQLLGLLDLSGSLHEIVVDSVISFGSDGKHTCFSADVSNISSVEVLGNLRDGFKIDFSLLRDVSGVDLQDVES